MACLGGTYEHPKPWMRHWPDGRVQRIDGRICTDKKRLLNPHTSRRSCAGCPAFRGLRWDGTVANGLGTDNETPVGLSIDESARYEEAMDAALIEDDYEPLFGWLSRQDRELVTNPDGTHHVIVGIGERGLRRIGDPGATERAAAYMREYRKSHPDPRTYAERKDDRAAYMRSYRARKKAEHVTQSTPITTTSNELALEQDRS
jgi:hypothetical protein